MAFEAKLKLSESNCPQSLELFDDLLQESHEDADVTFGRVE